jgi:hypothetical protein
MIAKLAAFMLLYSLHCLAFIMVGHCVPFDIPTDIMQYGSVRFFGVIYNVEVF